MCQYIFYNFLNCFFDIVDIIHKNIHFFVHFAFVFFKKIALGSNFVQSQNDFFIKFDKLNL